MTKVTIDRALIEQAIDALANVGVSGPDDDGVIWINLPGNGVTGKAILRVGKSGLIAAQCATLFDEQRVGAIAALRAALAEPAVEPRNGWLEAAVAWEVCASIHADFAKGKDPLYKTRHNDFVSHAERARKNATTSPPPPAEPPPVPLLSDEERS